MDLCYILTLFTPFKLALLIVEEFARAKKMYAGITLATSVYPNSLLAIALIGMIKGVYNIISGDSPVSTLF